MDIQCFFGKKELRYSLGTGYLGEAKLKARRLAGIVQQLIQELREKRPTLMKLSDKQIQDLVIKYLEKVKAGYDQPASIDADDPPPFDTAIDFRSYLDGLEDIKSDLQFELAKGDHTRVKEDAKALMQEILHDGELALPIISRTASTEYLHGPGEERHCRPNSERAWLDQKTSPSKLPNPFWN